MIPVIQMEKTKNILIVCWGNIHRSVIAEEMLRKILNERSLQDEYAVESRGIQGAYDIEPAKHPNLRDYPETYESTREALEQYGIFIPESKRSQPMTSQDLASADVILAIGSESYEKIMTNSPITSSKLRLLADIKDPHGSSDQIFLKEVVDDLHEAVEKFADEYFV